MMINDLSRNWSSIVLRGAAAIVFGLLAWFLPGVTLAILLVLFGVYALIDGVVALVAAARGTGAGSRGWHALQGVLSIAVGLLALFWPGLTAAVLLILIAAWAIATGVLAIIASIQLRKQIEREWLLAVSGVLSLLFGVLLLANVAAGALAMIWLIGTYAILLGITLVWLGIRVRDYTKAYAPVERQRPERQRPTDRAA